MPRIPRMVRTGSGQKTVYHVMSRTALDGFPFKNEDKDELVRVINRFSMIYAVNVLSVVIMSNYFNILPGISPAFMFSDALNMGARDS